VLGKPFVAVTDNGNDVKAKRTMKYYGIVFPFLSLFILIVYFCVI